MVFFMKENQNLRLDIKTNSDALLFTVEMAEFLAYKKLKDVYTTVDKFFDFYNKFYQRKYPYTTLELLTNIDLQEYDGFVDFRLINAHRDFNCANSSIKKFPNTVGGRFTCTGIDLSDPELVFPTKIKEFAYIDATKDFKYLIGHIPNCIESAIILDDSLFDRQFFIKDGKYTDNYYDALNFMSLYGGVEIRAQNGITLKKVIEKIQKQMEKLILKQQTSSYENVSKDEMTVNEFIKHVKQHKKFKKYKLEKYKNEELSKLIEDIDIKLETKKDANNKLVKCFFRSVMNDIIDALEQVLSEKINQEKQQKYPIKTNDDLDINDILDILKQQGYFDIYKSQVLKSVVKVFLSQKGKLLRNAKDEKIYCISKTEYARFNIKKLIKSSVETEIQKIQEKAHNHMDRDDIFKFCRSEKLYEKYQDFSDEQLRKFIQQALNSDKSIKQINTVSGKCILSGQFEYVLSVLDSHIKIQQEREQQQQNKIVQPVVKEQKIEQKPDTSIKVATIKIDKYIPNDIWKSVEKSCHKKNAEKVLYDINTINLNPLDMESQGAVQAIQDGKLVIYPTIKREYGCTLTQSCDSNRNKDRKRLVWTVGDGPNGPVFVAKGFVEQHVGSPKVRNAYNNLLEQSSRKQAFSKEYLDECINIADFVKNGYVR